MPADRIPPYVKSVVYCMFVCQRGVIHSGETLDRLYNYKVGMTCHRARRCRHLALHDRQASGLLRIEIHPVAADKPIQTGKQVVRMTHIWWQVRRVIRECLDRKCGVFVQIRPWRVADGRVKHVLQGCS